MPAPSNAMWFRVNVVNGTVWPIVDSAAAQSSPGDGMIAVTGVPAGVTAEQVRALLYAGCGIPLGFGAYKFSISYFSLITPNAVPTGWIALPTNPSANNTITLNGTTWTFVASGAVGPQTNIGGSAAATMTTLVTNLNASADAQVSKNTYAALPGAPTTLQITSKTAGTGNNGYTLATNVSGGSVSSGGMTGGGTSNTPTPFTIP